MKKLFCFLIILQVAFYVTSQVTIKQGSLIYKELTPYSLDGDAELGTKILKVTDVSNKNTEYSVYLYSVSTYKGLDYGMPIGLFNSAEINDVISALEYMQTKLQNFTASTPYTEIIFSCKNNITMGLRYEKKPSFFIKSNEYEWIDANKLPKIIDFFKNVKIELAKLDGNR